MNGRKTAIRGQLYGQLCNAQSPKELTSWRQYRQDGLPDFRRLRACRFYGFKT